MQSQWRHWILDSRDHHVRQSITSAPFDSTGKPYLIVYEYEFVYDADGYEIVVAS